MDSCRDCHAWGVTRLHDWRCGPCNHWRRAYPTIAECRTCGRARSLGRHGVCRLCHVQAQRLRRPDGEFDPYFANRHGQQLFFALRVGRATVMADAAGSAVSNAVSAPLPSSGADVGYCQLTLFTSRPDLSILGRAGLHSPRPQRTSRQARSPCERHRQPPRLEQEDDQRCVHRCCASCSASKTIPMARSTPATSSSCAGSVWACTRCSPCSTRPASSPTIGTPALDRWALPRDRDAPRAHAKRGPAWFDVMKNGATTPPRRRPRTDITVRLHCTGRCRFCKLGRPSGHSSLREITKTMVLDALPASGNPRSTTGQGLKSVFRFSRLATSSSPTPRLE